MATLKSIATGNWSSASTWGLCNSTAELDSEAGSTASTTSYVTSSAFTPGAITISGICLKVQARTASPTGTFSVSLFDTALVSGTEVVVNATDINFCDTTDVQGGWYFFKFASDVTLVTATAYKVQIKSSVASTITLYRDATAGNWSRQLVTTTTQAPVAGDKLLVLGDKTGAGTNNAYTVTMNSTTNTDYGTASTTLASLAVGHDATLAYGTTSATNYVLRLSGLAVVYAGGTFTIGTTGTPMPRDSSGVLEFDCAADGDFGLDVRGGTFTSQGLSRTSGKLIDRCLLNANASVSSTSLTVDTDTGWLSGDEVVIGATNRTTSGSELRSLTSNAGASTLAVSATSTQHDGNSNVKADIALLTRNVVLRNVTTTAVWYLRCRKTATVDIDWTEIKYAGTNATGKYGVVLEHTTAGSGQFNMNNSTVRNSEYTGIYMNGTDKITIDTCVLYANPGAGNQGQFSTINQSATTGVVFTNNIVIAGNTAGIYLNCVNITCTNNRVIANSTGINFTDTVSSVCTGTFSGNYFMSNNSSGIVQATHLSNITLTNFTFRRSVQYGFTPQGPSVITIASSNFIGNGNYGIYFSNFINMFVLTDCVFAGETGYAQTSGIQCNQGVFGTILGENCTFGVASGALVAHSSNDINCTTIVTNPYFLFRKCMFASTNELGGQANMTSDAYIISESHDQTVGALKIFKKMGTITRDTSISGAASPSYRMAPTSATLKLGHLFHRAAVASGSTATIKVKVRESVVGDGTDYNGSRIRLIVKRNVIAGITSDTVLATATSSSEGAFEELTGTTASVSADCILEFCVDCDGTTGWINFDDVTSSTATDTLGLKYGDESLFTTSWGNNSTGGGGGGSATVGYAFVT